MITPPRLKGKTMTELKCPFCQQRLLQEYNRQRDAVIYHCTHCYFQGDGILWQELIRTRKALDVALDAIDKGEAALIGCQEADDKYISDVTAEDGLELMSKAYKQIKELNDEKHI